jgi:hypothetical protein
VRTFVAEYDGVRQSIREAEGASEKEYTENVEKAEREPARVGAGKSAS